MCPKILRKLWNLQKVIWIKGKVFATVLATGRRNIYIQREGIETCDRIPNNLFAERRGENILCCTCKTYDSKSVHWHISTERRCCLEHTSVISQIIHEAKVNNKDLTVIWLDLANAYGSIPHKLIDEALKHYYIPEHIQGIINGYFDGLQLLSSVGEETMSWLHHLSSTCNGHEPNHLRC